MKHSRVLACVLWATWSCARAQAAFVSGTETFDGTARDTATWEMWPSSGGNISQNDALLLKSISDYTTRSFPVGIGNKVRADVTLGQAYNAVLYLTSNSGGTAQETALDSAYFAMEVSRLQGITVGTANVGKWPIASFSSGDENKTFTLELERTSATSVLGAVYLGNTCLGKTYVSSYGVSPAVPDNLAISLATDYFAPPYLGPARFDNVTISGTPRRPLPGIVDQHYEVPPGYAWGYIVGKTQSVAQTFKASKNGVLTGVELQLSRNESVPDNGIQVEIWPTLGGTPLTNLGHPLASAFVPASSALPIGTEFITADLTAAHLQVHNGDVLAIVARTNADYLGTGNVDPFAWTCWDPTYTRGEGFVGYGSQWGRMNYDFCFRTYVAAVPEPGTLALFGVGAVALVIASGRRARYLLTSPGTTALVAPRAVLSWLRIRPSPTK